MLREIFRLRNEFEGLLAREGEDAELVSSLRRRGYSEGFITYFIVPLASSLWSTDPVKMQGFPLKTFVRFFQNHGFLHVRQPIEWRTIKRGSRQYVDRLTAPFRDRIRLRCAATEIRRRRDGVDVALSDGTTASFDHVVLATHSDQALALLADPTPEESNVLGVIPYQENETVLHTDTRLLPSRRVLWASWNYSIPSRPAPKATITYDMNILQSIPAPVEFCVSLNQTETIDPARVIERYTYHHPLYTPAAPAAQRRHAEISGKNRTHYCGAYWGYGFHEDGVRSALDACKFFGGSL
jgi:predicted NAD/FAD-binding protein